MDYIDNTILNYLNANILFLGAFLMGIGGIYSLYNKDGLRGGFALTGAICIGIVGLAITNHESYIEETNKKITYIQNNPQDQNYLNENFILLQEKKIQKNNNIYK